MKRALWMVLWCCVPVCAGAAEIRAVDADGKERVLNAANQVTLVLYTNAALQEKTREAARAVDVLQGRPGFRVIVVADMRGTLALMAKGYTQRRMQRDLDAEAQRVEPWYRKNGNRESPRPHVSAVADFKGEVCEKLGWEKSPAKLHAVLFGRNGREVKRWEDLKNYTELLTAAEGVL